MIKLKPIKKNEKIAIAIPTKNRQSYLWKDILLWLPLILWLSTYLLLKVVLDKSKRQERGNFVVFDRHRLETGDKLFNKRLKNLKRRQVKGVELRRYNISDLEKKIYKSLPMVTITAKIKRALTKNIYSMMFPIRNFLTYMKGDRP